MARTDDSQHDQRHVRLLPCYSAPPAAVLDMPAGREAPDRLHATKAYQSMSRPRSFETSSTAAAPPHPLCQSCLQIIAADSRRSWPARHVIYWMASILPRGVNHLPLSVSPSKRSN
ncbi:hypothetical protein IG631_08024 [Alternaria alternata]|nr:hypothetical protein IG631_08024 [Alternaria alternata]